MNGYSVNAWLFLEEDEPKGTSYKDPTSCYQSLITNKVYQCVDMLSICWVATVEVENGCSIALQSSTHPPADPGMPDISNQQYMEWVIEDARRVNPDIKIVVMLGYRATEITQIFSSEQDQWQAEANQYAQNIVAYLESYGLDGLDVDWEPKLSSSTTPDQFALAFAAIGEAFAAQDPPLILTISPSTSDGLDPATVNTYFPVVTPQYYCGVQRSEFTDAGIDERLLAYGAKFETAHKVPYQSAVTVYGAVTDGSYRSLTQWRLNSGNFMYEQAQQMILYQMLKGSPGAAFDDGPIIAAAGNPTVSQMVIRSGDVLDAIEVTNQGLIYSTSVTYPLIQHGGDGGQAQTVGFEASDPLTKVSGYTGVWFGNSCVLQITLETRSGRASGPYGTMDHALSKQPFTLSAPEGQSIVAFSGATLPVMVAGGGRTTVVGSLAAAFA